MRRLREPTAENSLVGWNERLITVDLDSGP